MPALDLLRDRWWGLDTARSHAGRQLARPDRVRAARQIVAYLLTENPEQRVRAADLARRITEKAPEFFMHHAPELAAILVDTPIAESRARWHLGLVVARSARTSTHIRLAAEVLWQLAEDKSNGVRSSAVEGLGLLAWRDGSLRNTVEPYLHRALSGGTPAMRVRARDALLCLQVGGAAAKKKRT